MSKKKGQPEMYHARSHEESNVQTIQQSSRSDSGTFECFAIFISYLFLIAFFPVAILCCYTQLFHFQRVVIFRLGRLRYQEAKGPGLVFFLPCVDELHTVDLRIDTIDIEAQEVLTKDSVTILIDGCVFYYIVDPLLAITSVANYRSSTGLLAATILRNVVGMKNLKSVLMDRREISNTIQSLLDEGTDPWGIKVMRVELQEIMLPISMQRAMATEAEAEREAKAKVIAADGELQASRTLKEASDVISKGSMALQLRYLQTLATLTSEKKSVIMFPVPVDILPTSIPSNLTIREELNGETST